MGECLLARGAGGSGTSKDPLDDIPVVAGYCSILVTLKDSGGGLCSNMMVNCKDGTKWYNYKTNEQGMALFQCNSGSANFNLPNYYNDGTRLIYMLDQANIPGLVVDAPVGTKMAKEIMFNRLSSFNSASLNPMSFTSNINGVFRDTTKITNLVLIGGGGKGANGYWTDPNGTGWRSTEYGGGGGGGGAKNYAASVAVTKNQVYYLAFGIGGGISGTSAGAGGTTTGFGYSANGGSAATSNVGGKGGVGLYNGGNGGNGWYEIGGTGTRYNATTGSNGTNGAGGGGGGGGLLTDSSYGYTYGGTGGGRGGNWKSEATAGTNFTGGGGGGGASNYNGNNTYRMGKIGGYGKLTFNM